MKRKASKPLTVRDYHNALINNVNVNVAQIMMKAYKDAFMNHPAKSPVRGIVNDDRLRDVSDILSEEVGNFGIHPSMSIGCW